MTFESASTRNNTLSQKKAPKTQQHHKHQKQHHAKANTPTNPTTHHPTHQQTRFQALSRENYPSAKAFALRQKIRPKRQKTAFFASPKITRKNHTQSCQAKSQNRPKNATFGNFWQNTTPLRQNPLDPICRENPKVSGIIPAASA